MMVLSTETALFVDRKCFVLKRGGVLSTAARKTGDFLAARLSFVASARKRAVFLEAVPKLTVSYRNYAFFLEAGRFFVASASKRRCFRTGYFLDVFCMLI